MLIHAYALLQLSHRLLLQAQSTIDQLSGRYDFIESSARHSNVTCRKVRNMYHTTFPKRLGSIWSNILQTALFQKYFIIFLRLSYTLFVIARSQVRMKRSFALFRSHKVHENSRVTQPRPKATVHKIHYLKRFRLSLLLKYHAFHFDWWLTQFLAVGIVHIE